MTPTNITAKNADAITAKLAAVNGRASAHALTGYVEIAYIAAQAEKTAHALLGSQKAIVGATWTETSGEKMCNAYARAGYSRAATRITMIRRASGWFLTDVERVEVGQQGGGPGILTLTAEQDAIAIQRTRSHYRVAPAQQAAA